MGPLGLARRTAQCYTRSVMDGLCVSEGRGSWHVYVGFGFLLQL